jgi:peptidoglycan/xylan/chitin deacetylase (PgdA/CDA1 family)
MKINPTSAVTRTLSRGSEMLARPFTSASQNCLGVLTAVATHRPVVALTFDDGPDPENTPALLNILAKHDARATFFMIGELAIQYPRVVRAAAQAGHVVANHSWSHLSFPLLTARERYEQLRRCKEALAPYGAMLFRPPYCHQTLGSRWQTLCAGYEVVAFNVHVEDWLARPAEWMSDRLVRQTRPGSIVILHDNIYHSALTGSEPDRKPMLRALDDALERLQQRFRFVTVPELLRMGRPLRENWYRQGQDDMRPALQRYLMEHRQRSIDNRDTQS